MAAQVPRWTGTLSLTETPESGIIVIGERTTLTRVFEGTYANCRAGMLARGTFGTGSMLGWVVASCKVDSIKGARGKLTITWEPGGASATMPLPCPDFNLEGQDLYPRIERHQMFNQTSTGTGSMPDITIETMLAVNAVVRASTGWARNLALAVINATPSTAGAAANPPTALTDADQQTMALNLLDKLRKGEETYYLAGFKYTWWYFSYTLPILSDGGIIETPSGPGVVATAFPADQSWLRLADNMIPVGVNGSMFKITLTYLGGPQGHWDSDIYS